MEEIASSVIIALVFYAVIPLFGAFNVRSGWRKFREQILKASVRTELEYSKPDRHSEGDAGLFWFIGNLQAIQNESTVWVSNGKLSVRAELQKVSIYILPNSQAGNDSKSIEKNQIADRDEMPRKMSWEHVYSLPQGTSFLFSGKIFIENGIPVFRNTEEEPLLALIYDGAEETLLRRSIWSGRQINEYWNSFTPVSLIAGSLSLFINAYLVFRNPALRPEALFILVMSIIPLLALMPPGILFFLIYKWLWRTGRILRGERDLIKLPMRYFNEMFEALRKDCFFLEYPNCSAAKADYPDAVIRSSGILKRKSLDKYHSYVFLSSDNDVFFERLIIPGNPNILSQICRSRARLMEISAMVFFTLGLLLNSILAYIALVKIIL